MSLRNWVNAAKKKQCTAAAGGAEFSVEERAELRRLRGRAAQEKEPASAAPVFAREMGR